MNFWEYIWCLSWKGVCLCAYLKHFKLGCAGKRLYTHAIFILLYIMVWSYDAVNEHRLSTNAVPRDEKWKCLTFSFTNLLTYTVATCPCRTATQWHSNQVAQRVYVITSHVSPLGDTPECAYIKTASPVSLEEEEPLFWSQEMSTQTVTGISRNIGARFLATITLTIVPHQTTTASCALPSWYVDM